MRLEIRETDICCDGYCEVYPKYVIDVLRTLYGNEKTCEDMASRVRALLNYLSTVKYKEWPRNIRKIVDRRHAFRFLMWLGYYINMVCEVSF